MKWLTRITAAVLSLACAFAAQADDFPSRPLRIIVPYPPGGSADAQARILGQKLSEELSQPVVVESKPGAGTTIGAAYVANSTPDGYTLYLAGTSHSISATLYRHLPYDAVKSFAPISLLAVSPFVLTVYPEEHIKSVKQLLDMARAKPGELTFASSGSGAGPHMCGELMQLDAGVKMLHVPYKGTAPALNALLGKQVNFLFADVAAIPLIKAGKLDALAVTTTQRVPQLPDVPTMQEAGLKGYDTPNWSAILAPAGTPPAIVAKLNHAIVAALKDPHVREQFEKQGFEPTGSTPEELEAHLVNQVAHYAEAIKASGARVD